MKKYFALIIGMILAATLCFAASAGDKTVVYLSSLGAGDGSSAESATADIEAAYNALDLSKDCTIVVCAPFFQFQNFSYGKEFTGSVTMTSVYDGVDYRETAGAVYQFESVTNTCWGDTRFENINFESLFRYPLRLPA